MTLHQDSTPCVPEDAPQRPKSNVQSAVVIRTSNAESRVRSLYALDGLSADILLEIYNYCRPLELLYLARTSKAFRSFLMSKTSMTIWKTSRQMDNLHEMPPCPPSMSEPAYANLVFTQQCTCCGWATENVYFSFNARYCHSCRMKKLIPRAECMPAVKQAQLFDKHITLNALFVDELISYVPITSGYPPSLKLLHLRAFHKPAIDKFNNGWRALEDQSDAAKKQFLDDWKANVAYMREHRDRWFAIAKFKMDKIPPSYEVWDDWGCIYPKSRDSPKQSQDSS